MKMVRAIILLLFFPLITSAQSADSLRRDTITHAFPEAVFVMAPKSKDLFSVSTITSRDISLQATPIIAPMINQHAGIWMQSAGLNTHRISIRGVGYREPFATTGIKIYLDEIPVTNGVGESSIEDIHPDLFSRVEIWRGPSSAIWGSGLGGMMHLQLQQPAKDELVSSLQVGSFGRLQLDQTLHVRYGKMQQHSTSIHYQGLSDDGFRANNNYDRHSATWIQQWLPGKFQVKAIIHAIDLKAFIPSSLHVDHFNASPWIAAPNWAAVSGNEDYVKWISGLSMQYTFHRDLLYRANIFYNNFRSDEVRPFNVLEESNRSFGSRQRLIWTANPHLMITTGFEYFRERYTSSLFETLSGGTAGDPLGDDQSDHAYFHSFLQLEGQQGEKWRYYAGVSTSNYHLANAMHEINAPLRIYPAVGLSYDITQELRAGFSWSRGYTPFGIDDVLDSQGSINQDVKPEQGWSKEISLSYNLPVFRMKMTGYDMIIDQTIITRRLTEDTFEKINGGGSRHQGIEIEYDATLLPDHVFWKGSYTLQNNIFKNFTDNGIDFSGLKLPGTPDHRIYNQLLWMLKSKFSLMLEHHWVDRVFLNDANTLQSDSYHLLHAGMGYAFEVSENIALDLNARVHNLLDAHYASMFQINALAPGNSLPRHFYPGQPRSLYFKACVRYHLHKAAW